MAGQDPPEFTVTYRIDGSWQTYTALIQDLRNRAADPNAESCLGLQQLPSEDADKRRSRRSWFAVILVTDEARITLRIRRQNLYLDAYQMGEGGRWVEYNSSYGRLYPDSVLLEYCDGSYPQLEVDTPRRGNIPLTLENLTVAVNILAVFNEAGSAEARTYQIVVIQMICEAMRLDSIARYVAHGLAITGVPDWVIGREGSWRRLSRLLRAFNADRSQPYDQSQEFIDETKIKSFDEVVDTLGIVKPKPQEQFPRMAQDFDFGGGPKVEVFEFYINNVLAGQLYGEITGDQVFIHYLYNRDIDDPEPVYAGDFPLLTGPKTAAISACDTFQIDVTLWNRLYDGGNILVSQGKTHWNVYNLSSDKAYDKFMEETYAGHFGYSATIRYAVFSDAVGAHIEVKLINGDDEDPANVYGHISAVNTKLIEGESVLFRQPKEGRIDIRPGEQIPLSRAIVAVPVNSNFHVRAKLWDYDFWSPDDEIANGTAIFKPRRYGTDTQQISGEYGKIEVKVTWKI